MKKLSKLLLLTVFLFTACNSKTEKKTTEKQTTRENLIAQNTKNASTEASPSADQESLTKLPTRNLPITDSTSFDNFEESGIPDKGFLKRIKFDPRRKDATKFRLNYKIPFSENFTSVVVSYQGGEHELFSTLITIDKEFNIIDQLEIAYDEIAESAFGKTSKIEKNKITVTSSNRMEVKPIFRDETYVLANTGKFKRL